MVLGGMKIGRHRDRAKRADSDDLAAADGRSFSKNYGDQVDFGPRQDACSRRRRKWPTTRLKSASRYSAVTTTFAVM